MKPQTARPSVISLALLLLSRALLLHALPARSAELPPGPLDVESAQDAALRHNPSFAETRERMAQAAYRLAEARSAWWPQLSAQAGASRVDLADRLVSGTQTDNPQTLWNAELRAEWLLFDGLQREFNAAAARHGRNAAQADAADARRLLRHGVARSFRLVQLAREEERIAGADLAFYERLAAEAQARRDAGEGSLADLLAFRVRANDARAMLIEARRAAESALAALAELMAVDPPELAAAPLAPPAPETDADFAEPSREELLKTAARNRPDLRRAREDAAAASAAARAARGDLYPRLHLTASHGGERPRDASFRDDDFGTTVGVAASFNLFEGGRTRARIAQADSQSREIHLALQSIENALEREIADALSSLSAAQRQTRLQTENLDLVRQSRDLVEREYRAGQESLLRLTEAQRDLVAAESRLARARTHLRLAWHTLDSVLGDTDSSPAP